MPERHNTVEIQPTLIVGVGGTGTLVCQHAYDLFMKRHGCIPPFIRFLALDTDRQEEAGPTKLPPEDFFNLFEDLELGEVIRDLDRFPGFHPHLSWLQAMNLDPGSAGYGCQGLNRLGRAVFFELRERIHQIVAARMASLNDTDVMQRQLEPFQDRFSLGRSSKPAIHIASSVCGGTGAGLLIDLAYNLRFWAKDEFHKDAHVMAHLVLPEAFSVNPERIKDKLRTVACATLQQIELLTAGERRDLPVQYPNKSTKLFERLMAPFDYTYLLSGTAPGGSIDRGHLTEMIARMIRAMTAEPAAVQIFADANNKQTDILTQHSERNMRQLGFSSYGLRYGISGALADRNDHPDAYDNQSETGGNVKLVRSWVCDALTRVADVTARSKGVDDREIDDILDRELNLDKSNFNRTTSLQYSDAMPGEMGLDKHFDKELKSHLAECREQFGEEAQKNADSAGHGILDAVMRLTEEIFKNAEIAPSSAYAFLTSCHGKIEERRIRMRKYEGPSIEQADFDAASAVIKDLHSEAGQSTLRDMSTSKIDSIANRALEQHYPRMAKAHIHRHLQKSLIVAYNRLGYYITLLRNLARSAKRELAEIGGVNVGQIPSAEYFAEPLFRLENPSSTKIDSMEALRTQYHQDIIAPLLLEFMGNVAPEEAPRIAESYPRFGEVLNGLAEPMEGFLSEYEKTYKSTFRRPLGNDRPSEHLFYDPIRNIDQRTEAQIVINQKRRFDDTLDVIVSQHPDGTCIPDLLSVNSHRSHRRAILTDEAEDYIWFQLHKFRYGFCLPALDDYETYLEATQRHLERTGFEHQDFWLDADWLNEYEKLMANCEAKAAFKAPTKTQPTDAATVLNELVAKHKAFYELIDKTISAYREEINNDAGSLIDYYKIRGQAMEGLRNGKAVYLEEVARIALELADQATETTYSLHSDVRQTATEALKDLKTACRSLVSPSAAATEPLNRSIRISFDEQIHKDWIDGFVADIRDQLGDRGTAKPKASGVALNYQVTSKLTEEDIKDILKTCANFKGWLVNFGSNNTVRVTVATTESVSESESAPESEELDIQEE